MASTQTTTTNTMSLKRYAIIAAASSHKSHQQNDNHNITIVKTTTKAEAVTTEAVTESKTKLVTSTASTSPSLSPPLATESQSSITTAKTSLFSSFYAYGDDGDGDSDEINDNNSSSGSSVPPAFYGGLSPFHQQNIRSGHGINGSNGASYPNAINGNVNLLLGGAMLSLVTTILCVVCYCCHRSIKKRTEAAYRQQRQWLESDPNMEIYSVEQCYETSGLFMAESNDGVPTLATLHHEPPPSYDAVVLMHEQQLLYQQQQQQLLQQQQHPQRTSPPPGYRSTLDVSMTVATAATTTAAIPTATFYTTTDATSYNNSNTDNHSNNSCDTINDSLNTVSSVRRCDFSKSITNSITTANQLFNMKRVWSAQSCCSLQRAEVESMWNAAAAAVAARATHAEHVAEQQQQSTTSSIMVRKTLPSTAATPSATARISTPSARAASSSSVERFGQHYLKESFYQRGCPLCGKFRYDVDDCPISISIESDLDQSMEMNGNKKEVIREGLLLDGGNKMSTVTNEKNKNTQEPHGTAAGHQKLIGAATEATDGDSEECSCAATASNMPIAAVVAASRNYLDGTNSIEDEVDADANIKDNNKENVECDDDDDDENGNLAAYVGSGDLFECYAVSPELDEFYHAADEADKVHASLCNRTTADNNANPTLSPPSTATVVDAVDDASSRDNIELVDLSSINDNGIVRLDMSKIIDNTGLPTYEAALKFDSSGYV